MKVSGFTFLRNAQQLGYPFLESIASVLPLVDEFIVNVGHSQDDTLALVKAIDSPKIKIIETEWNESLVRKGFVYAQQKMIAQYSCTGDWVFYLEGDELLHEQDYEAIREAMRKHRDNKQVEALVFDYLHFYGNQNTYAWSPAWYRRAPRVIKSSVRNYAGGGLFWVVLDDNNKKGRYPRAALANATIYHYGWVRPEDQMKEKAKQVSHYWAERQEKIARVNYKAIDPKTLHLFQGSHPAVLKDYFPAASGLFQADPQHQLTRREKKNRIALALEKYLPLEFSKKHFSLVE